MSFEADSSPGVGSRGRPMGRQPAASPAMGYQSGYDPDQEYKGLLQTAADNVQTIAANVQQLKKMSDLIGSKKDNEQLRNKLSALSNQTRDMALSTGRLLKQLHNMKSQDPMENNRRKGQLNKLTGDLNTQLSQFKQVSEKESKETKKAIAAQKANMAISDLPDDGRAPEESEESKALLAQRQEHQRMDSEIEFNQNLIEDREQSIMEIEANIQEVNEIFRDLATMVRDQGEDLNTIESNIESTLANTQSAHSELKKANEYQKASRNKLCCLAIIVSLVLLAIVVPVAISLRH